MICKVIDDLFDKFYLYEIENHINSIPLHTTNIANRSTWPYGLKGTHRLFGSVLYDRTELNDINYFSDNSKPFLNILNQLEKTTDKKFFLKNISLNVQHSGCDGTMHIDSENENEITILMMSNSEWDSNWGGQFQILSSDGKEIIEEYEYIPGRILLIPSNVPHRGLGPIEKYTYRTTVVWRVIDFLDYLNCKLIVNKNKKNNLNNYRFH